MEKIDLIIEFLIKHLEENRDSQKFHKWLKPNCKECKERDEFIKKLRLSI